MFKGIIYTCNRDNNSCWVITDDDFVENVYDTSSTLHIYDAVIQTYENRNLNVAANMVLYFKSFHGHSLYDPTNIKYTKHSKLYSKYKEEIEKYLLLL